MRTLSTVLALAAMLAAGTAAAAVGKAAGTASSAIGKQDVRDAIFKLKSPNPEEVLSSVQILAASGSKDAVNPLTDLLLSGPRDDITNAIITALGSIGDRASVDVLISYLNHRRPDARVVAIMAIEGYKEAKVTSALEGALRDSDVQVRSTAAMALGKRGSKGSVPILFQAFDRGVADAAIAIGQIGSPADAQRLAGYLGKNDVKLLLPGFDEFLRRADFAEPDKIKILDRLFELAGPDVRRFAVAYKASFPQGTEEDKSLLYKKVCQMVRQIPEE
ncbi:MAG: HEAT repeat domain-containing protein [Deltaproteobacteria bacterium]|nr:HEAT repeat domain-containing protein [Deltaproteobacteria bacterium]